MTEFIAFIAGICLGGYLVVRTRKKTYQHLYEAGWREGWESAVTAAKAYSRMRRELRAVPKQTPDQPLN